MHCSASHSEFRKLETKQYGRSSGTPNHAKDMKFSQGKPYKYRVVKKTPCMNIPKFSTHHLIAISFLSSILQAKHWRSQNDLGKQYLAESVLKELNLRLYETPRNSYEAKNMVQKEHIIFKERLFLEYSLLPNDAHFSIIASYFPLFDQ